MLLDRGRGEEGRKEGKEERKERKRKKGRKDGRKKEGLVTRKEGKEGRKEERRKKKGRRKKGRTERRGRNIDRNEISVPSSSTMLENRLCTRVMTKPTTFHFMI